MARPTGVVSIADSIPNIPNAPQADPAAPLAQDTLPVQAALNAQPTPELSLGDYAAGAVASPAPAAAPPEKTPEEIADEQRKLPPFLRKDVIEAEAKKMADGDAPEVKEAEVVSKALSLDIVKRTEYGGNVILEMSTAQRSAYDREVSEVQEKIRGAERAYVLAQWYMGSTAMKLQKDARDNAGSTYGQATVEGFAHDIGRDKSTVYKSMKLAKSLSFAHAQALTITVEAFQVIQKAPDKIRDWVIDEVVKRCQSGQKFDTYAIERVVETLTWYPSIAAAQAENPAEVQKALDAIMSWDPKPLPGKDKPVFDFDAAKKAIGGAAPELLPAVKSDEKSAKSAEKEKREKPGVNSATGTSHIGVAKSFAKALDTIIEKAGSLTISMSEAPDDDLSEKAYETFSELITQIVNDADNAIDVLTGIKTAAEALTEPEPEPEKPSKGPKKKAKARSAAKKKK